MWYIGRDSSTNNLATACAVKEHIKKTYSHGSTIVKYNLSKKLQLTVINITTPDFNMNNTGMFLCVIVRLAQKEYVYDNENKL